VVHLLNLNSEETATQLMVEDFTLFRQIEQTEYVDYIFDLKVPKHEILLPVMYFVIFAFSLPFSETQNF
jgi:hypothetical protein